MDSELWTVTGKVSLHAGGEWDFSDFLMSMIDTEN